VVGRFHFRRIFPACRKFGAAETRQLLTLFGMRPARKMTVAPIHPFPLDEEKQVDVEVTLRCW
jgi:hypothetical protein